MGKKIRPDFYLEQNVETIAKQLLGKKLCTHIDGVLTSGFITECEAYGGINDKACHANNGRRTPRTEVFFKKGGIGYVYICYGVHHMFNIITNHKNIGDAVLIRSIEPVDGVNAMLQRRGLVSLHPSITKGPGNVCQAMGITMEHNGISLQSNTLWIEENTLIPLHEIVITTRIGMGKAAEDDGLLLRRYYINKNKYVRGKLS